MIISQTTKRTASRWSQACIVLCAIAVLPLGMVYAQDYEAVGKRLKAAVAAGELTGPQARMMLGALKKASGPKEGQDFDHAKAHLMKVKKKLGAAIEAGKISKEDAVKRYQVAEIAVKNKLAAAGHKQQDAKQLTREDYANAETKIRKAVAAGTISAEDGRAKLRAMRKLLGAQKEGPDKKESDKKAVDRKLTREDYRNAEAKLHELVAAGKMTKEAAQKRLNGLRNRIAAQGKGGDRKSASEALARIEREIHQAVADGTITKEEGRAKLEATRKKLAQSSEPAPQPKVNWENIKRRVEGAVERGDMTRDEADAKYKEIRQRVAGDRQR